MEYEIYSGDAKAIISTSGGYVTNLSNADGDILFPKRSLRTAEGEQKTRGGCHVCLPNFGPDGGTGLGQHGYGRTSEWALVKQTETSITLELSGQGDYTDLQSKLTYTITPGTFTSELTVYNDGDKPLAVSPAFHPYFNLGGERPTLDGERHEDIDEFEGTLFVDGDTRTLDAAHRQLTIASQHLPRWALWTDRLGDYLCIEPTQGGYAFAEDMDRADTLEPGKELTYAYAIAWR